MGLKTQKSKHWRELGYSVGGAVDPYRPHREARSDQYAIKDYKRLNPGWGYKTVDRRKGIGGHASDFLRIAPLSTVTPLIILEHLVLIVPLQVLGHLVLFLMLLVLSVVLELLSVIKNNMIEL